VPRRDMILRWTPVVVWMAVIFGFSSLTGSELRPVSGLSTFGHLGEYAILGMLVFAAASRSWDWRRAAITAIAIASAYGVTDELHQFLTPGRMPDPADWAADTAGAAIGVALVMLVTWEYRRRRASSDSSRG
jgi:VanZ family protein